MTAITKRRPLAARLRLCLVIGPPEPINLALLSTQTLLSRQRPISLSDDGCVCARSPGHLRTGRRRTSSRTPRSTPRSASCLATRPPERPFDASRKRLYRRLGDIAAIGPSHEMTGLVVRMGGGDHSRPARERLEGSDPEPLAQRGENEDLSRLHQGEHFVVVLDVRAELTTSAKPFLSDLLSRFGFSGPSPTMSTRRWRSVLSMATASMSRSTPLWPAGDRRTAALPLSRERRARRRGSDRGRPRCGSRESAPSRRHSERRRSAVPVDTARI